MPWSGIIKRACVEWARRACQNHPLRLSCVDPPLRPKPIAVWLGRWEATSTFQVEERAGRMKVSHAIVFVGDMKRSIEFYRDAIGLTLRFESSHWTEFETVGATLALHLSESTGDRGSAAKSEAPGSCRPGFSVPDLQQFHRHVISKGVQCLQEPKDVFGAQVAMYLDPDGLAISVGEERRA